MRVMMAALAVAIAVNPADAVVLCAKPRGDGTFSTAVRIRETCRTSEVALDLAAMGLVPAVHDTGITVRDSAGKIVGAWYASTPRGSQAVRTINGHAVAFPILPYGFYDDQIVKTYYESADCSGPPLLRDQLIADPPPAAAHPDFLFVLQGFNLLGTAIFPTALRFSSTLGSYDYAGCAACAPFGCSCAPLTTAIGCTGQGGVFQPPDRCCFPYAGGPAEVVAETTTLPLESLEVVPPFHVEGAE